MASSVPIWIYGVDGLPLPTAEPVVLLHIDRDGADRPPFVGGVVHKADEVFAILPTDADLEVGTIAVIDCGADAWPRYQCVSLARDSTPFAAWIPYDADGNLSAGAPTVEGFVAIDSGDALAQPPVVKAGVHEVYSVTPSADDVLRGVSLRLEAPPGVFPLESNAKFATVDPPSPLPPPTSTGETVAALLAADATVVALVGTRMYPNVAPQGVETPYIVYQIVSDVPEDVLEPAADRLRNVRLQIDAYSKRYLEAHAVAEAVCGVLDAVDSPDFACWREIARDLYDDETQRHRVSTDFSIWR